MMQMQDNDTSEQLLRLGGKQVQMLDSQVDLAIQRCDQKLKDLETSVFQSIEDIGHEAVRLHTDYFFVNDEPFEISDNLDGQFVTMPDPGEFCVAAGQTVDMFSNVSIDNDNCGFTTLEILKNHSERVAVASFFDRAHLHGIDNKITSNGTVYYRETVQEDSVFEFRIKLINNGAGDDAVEVKNIQNSVRVYNNDRECSRSPIDNCSA